MIQKFLKSIPLFCELNDDELAQVLMLGVVKRHQEGTTIVKEGTTGGQLHVVHEGQVRISKTVPGAGEEALTILTAGELFGEVEFFDGGPASASAVAHSDCEILSIPHREIETLMRTRPELSAKFLWAFARTLAARLRETNQKVTTLLAISGEF